MERLNKNAQALFEDLAEQVMHDFVSLTHVNELQKRFNQLEMLLLEREATHAESKRYIEHLETVIERQEKEIEQLENGGYAWK